MKHLSPYIQAKLCDAIMVLLEDEASRICLSNFAHCLSLVELYKHEIPQDILKELHKIMEDYTEIGDEGDMSFRSAEFTDDEKIELAERLLSIYIDIKGGSLIF
jgi:hypothetical protein